MDQQNPGLSEQYRMASPWPLFVALGLPIAEIGILFGFFAVAVGGLLLFFGSIAGMLQESGYVSSPWRTLGLFAVLMFGLGGALVYGDGMVVDAVRLAARGYAVATAGAIFLVAAVVGEAYAQTRPEGV